MGEWAYGLFGCFDDLDEFFTGLLFGPVTVGRNAVSAGISETCCMGGACLFVPVFNILHLWKIRNATLEKFGIEEGFVMKLAALCCFNVCSQIQIARQYKQGPGEAVARA